MKDGGAVVSMVASTAEVLLFVSCFRSGAFSSYVVRGRNA